MSPVNVPDGFWAHIPSWLWPVIAAGIIGFFAWEAIRASESIAGVFGRAGKKIYERANRLNRMQSTIERIEETLDKTSDNLECATTYLVVVDTPWHHETEIILSEEAPHILRLLPARQPFIDFKKQWREGWRPEQSTSSIKLANPALVGKKEEAD